MHNFARNKVKIIFLVRRNEVARAVSAGNMMQSLGAHLRKEEKHRTKTIDMGELFANVAHDVKGYTYLVNNFQKLQVPVLYVPYETLNAQHDQFERLFHFLGITNVTVNGSTLRDGSIPSASSSPWTYTVTTASKHHKLDTMEYIQNQQEVLHAILSGNEPQAICPCMIRKPDCDYGDVVEVNPSEQFLLPVLCSNKSFKQTSEAGGQLQGLSDQPQFRSSDQAGKT
jgi:hypothetical protein